MQTLSVVAHIRARKDKQEEMLALLSGFVEPTRRETGCIRYQLYRNKLDPQDFTFIEEWTSDAALEQHLRTPHIQSGLSALSDLAEGSPAVLRYQLIA